MAVPTHLHINGRSEDQNFNDDEKLYRGFQIDEFDNTESVIVTEAIKFPDLSCNRSKYSKPEDIHYRENGNLSDGCYSFTVSTGKYKEWVMPVHDPLSTPKYPNYAHTELRARREADGPDDMPPKGRKIKNRAKKLEYREHLSKNTKIEFMPTPSDPLK